MRNLLLHLSLIPRVGPSIVERLVATVGNDRLLDLYEWSSHGLTMRARLSPSLADTIIQGLADITLLTNELDLIEKHAISWVTIIDEHYPPLLKHIHLPPIVLYWRGKGLHTLEKSVAFVGSRMATEYSNASMDMLIPSLVEHGWTIISGGAVGADTMAHRRAMRAGGSTAAVIGSGLLKPYPSTNRLLFESIIEQGLLISAFPLTMSAMPGNFPARNRIIAGLSRGVVVVQAGLKSGALITASFAIDQGREVGAVPGPITDLLSSGCNQLLRQGASVITNSGDLFEMLGEQYKVSNGTDTQASVDTRVFVDTHSSHALSGQLREIVYLCKTPQSFEELQTVTALSMSQLQEMLCNLQLDGYVEQTIQGFWHTCSP